MVFIASSKHLRLNALKDLLLEFPLNLVALVIGGRLAVKVQESAEVELGGLQELDLADVDLYAHLVNRPYVKRMAKVW
jgi:hypothetical protein